MISLLEPTYIIPSRSTFSRKIVPELYEEARQTVMESLVAAQTIAITTDGWTSRATDSYVTITAHFVDDSWKLQNHVLQTRPLNESHTGANIAEVLNSAAQEWQLDRPHRLQPLCSDSAGNMCLAATLANMNPHIKCFAHTINLAAQNILKIHEVQRLMGRVRRVVTYFHKSSTANHKLQLKQVLLNLPNHKLIMEVKTRWNSAFDMLERYLEQQPAIMAVLLSAGTQRDDLDTLTATDVTNTEQLIAVLQPLKTVTTVLCDAVQPTISMVWPLLCNLKSGMQPDANDSAIVQRVKQAALADLGKRYTSDGIQQLMLQASAIDPRFKTLPFIGPEERDSVYVSLIQMAEQIDSSCEEHAATVAATASAAADQRPVGTQPSVSSSTDVREVAVPIASTSPSESDELHEPQQPPPKKTALSSLLGQSFVLENRQPALKREIIIAEIKLYTARESLGLNGDPLAWWSRHQQLLPYLSKVASTCCAFRPRVCPASVYLALQGTSSQRSGRVYPLSMWICLFFSKQMHI